MSGLDERLNIPTEYFEEEMRSDFRVTEMMKRSWAAQIHLLKVLENFFRKHDIRYTATWGTLLGAIRHEGFIPWDDDIDINISRKDFRKLLKYAHELPHDIWILSIYSSDTFYNFHAVVKNNRRGSDDLLDEEREKEFCGFPFMTGVDIYILDNIPDDENKMKAQKFLYEFGYSLVHRYAEMERNAAEGFPAREEDAELFLYHMEQFLEQVRRVYGDAFRIDGDRPLLNELCRLVDGIAAYYCNVECKKVSSFTECPGKKLENWGRRKYLYRNPQKVPFEYTTIMVPERSKELLTTLFGESYMTPMRIKGKHEYPQYGSPAKVLGFNIEYAELQHYMSLPEDEEYIHLLDEFKSSRGENNKLIVVAYPLEYLVKFGGEALEEMEKVLDECSDEAEKEHSLVFWYAFGFLDEEDILWRSIPRTMRRYKELRDKYIGGRTVLDAFKVQKERLLGECDRVFGEGSVIDAYVKNKLTE